MASFSEHRTHTTKRGHRALRQCRVSIENRSYFITACTDDRRPLFNDAIVAELIFDRLYQLEIEYHLIELTASIIMPDHIHALFQLQTDATINEVMQRFRGSSAHAINVMLGRRGTVWQRGYFERRLRLNESLVSVLQYMWHNPQPPGRHFRCRTEVWQWFRAYVQEPPEYASWMHGNP